MIRIKNFLLRIIFILLFVYLLVFIPSLFGYKPLVIISGSMQPTLKVGGILYYNKIDLDDFEKGDILVYQTKNHIISHRIVDITNNGFITKGDANASADLDIIRPSQVLGEGTDWCIPYIGYYADYIFNHKYLLYIIVVIISLDLIITKKSNQKKVRESCEKIE